MQSNFESVAVHENRLNLLFPEETVWKSLRKHRRIRVFNTLHDDFRPQV